VGSLRSSAPDHDLGHLDAESLADYLTDVPWDPALNSQPRMTKDQLAGGIARSHG
jgi:hypothetical protein